MKQRIQDVALGVLIACLLIGTYLMGREMSGRSCECNQQTLTQEK